MPFRTIFVVKAGHAGARGERHLTPPVDARLEMKDSAGNAFLPVLCPGTHENSDKQLKLSRGTDWKSPEGGPVLGVGVHTFLVDDNASSLLDWLQLKIEG
jgi:protein involved in temperature-dependent protein secretion